MIWSPGSEASAQHRFKVKIPIVLQNTRLYYPRGRACYPSYPGLSSVIQDLDWTFHFKQLLVTSSPYSTSTAIFVLTRPLTSTLWPLMTDTVWCVSGRQHAQHKQQRALPPEQQHAKHPVSAAVRLPDRLAGLGPPAAARLRHGKTAVRISAVQRKGIPWCQCKAMSFPHRLSLACSSLCFRDGAVSGAHETLLTSFSSGWCRHTRDNFRF